MNERLFQIVSGILVAVLFAGFSLFANDYFDNKEAFAMRLDKAEKENVERNNTLTINMLELTGAIKSVAKDVTTLARDVGKLEASSRTTDGTVQKDLRQTEIRIQRLEMQIENRTRVE